MTPRTNDVIATYPMRSANGSAGAFGSTPKQDAQHALLRMRKLESRLSLIGRLFIGALGLASGALAVAYTWRSAEEMVATLSRPRGQTEYVAERLLALTAPAALLIAIAALSAAAIWAIHSRELDETYRTADAVNRIRRESEVAVSARGLIHSFEEKLQNVSRGLSVLLWFGRALFVLSGGSFVLAVGQATAAGVDLLTVAFGGLSIASVVLGIAVGLPSKICGQLTNVVALQTIITGCDRQISLLESEAFSLIGRGEQLQQRGGCDASHLAALTAIDDAVLKVQSRIDNVVARSVGRFNELITDMNGGK